MATKKEWKPTEETVRSSEKLKVVIADRGMTTTTLAEKSGISRHTLERRLNGYGVYTVLEINALCKALKLTVADRRDIFLI